MNITKLSAATGIGYLMSTVVTGDQPRRAGAGGMTAYYAAAGTPPGVWMGTGAALIGVQHGWHVTEEGAEALFRRGAHPITGAPLGGPPVQLHKEPEPVSAKKVSGFDLTFRVPKSVSILWGTADEEVQRAIMAAHHAAIDQTMAWVEGNVAQTRSGKGGVVASEIRGLVAARFDHFDTREGDPHLHSHVVVANKVQRATDGKWLTLDGSALYRSGVAISELHENLLLDELHRSLGLVFAERDRVTTRSTKAVVLDVAGVPADAVERFSTRSTQVRALEDELMDTWRRDNPGREPSRRQIDRFHQQAWAATRKPKDKQVRPLGELVRMWRGQLLELGHHPRDVAAAAIGHPRLTPGTRALAADRPVIDQLAFELLKAGRNSGADEPTEEHVEQYVESSGRDGVLTDAAEGVLTSVQGHRATWSRANLRAEAERLTRLIRCTDPGARAELVDAVTDRALSHCVPLTPTRYLVPESAVNDVRLALRGASVFDEQIAARFTTPAVLDAEAFLRSLVEQDLDAPRLEPDAARDAVRQASINQEGRQGFAMAEDQAAAAIAVMTDPARISAVVGPAGTGKTTTMRAAREAWEAEHGPGSVIGLATSARAAAELADSLGIETHTIAKFLTETTGPGVARRAGLLTKAAALEQGGGGAGARQAARLRSLHTALTRTYQVRPGQLVIIDEASMSGTFDLHRLAAQVQQAGAKMVLVGDPAQLDAVDAGGILGWLDRTGQTTRLSSIWRFAESWEAAASLRLRAGDTAGLDAYFDRSRIHQGTTEDTLDGAYTATRNDLAQGHSTILIAATNEHVAELNTRFTLDRRVSGAVDSSRTVPLRAGASAGTGEVILSRKTDRRLQDERGDFIRNGDLLTVTSIDPSGTVRAVRQDTGARITLDPGFLAEHVELGYATTAHRCQGVTVDRAHLAIASGEHMTRELLYVAMTRGRHSNDVWVGVQDAAEAHETHTPVTDIPTAFEVLARALAAEGAERTAHETRLDEHARAYSLDRLVAEYEYLAAHATGPRLEALLSDLHDAETVSLIRRGSAWEALVATWRAADTLDPVRTARLLALPVDDLDEVRDVAAVYHQRLEHAIVLSADPADRATWVAGLTPPVITDDEALAHAAAQCAAHLGRVVAEITDLEHLTGPDAPTWVSHLGPRPTVPDLEAAWDRLARTIATYRAMHHVSGDHPLGPRPYSDDNRHDRAWLRTQHLMSTWQDVTIDGIPVGEEPPQEWEVDVDVDELGPPDDLDALDVHIAPEHQLDAARVDEDTPVEDPAAAHARARTLEANAIAWDYWTRRATGSWVPQYLNDRGLTHVNAGHAPDGWTNLTDHLRAAKFTDEELLTTGLATVSRRGSLIDRFRDRMVIPVRDGQDNVIAFTARANPTTSRTDTPKYINSPATPTYDKSATLLGLDAAARARLAAGARPILVEGAMDLEAMRTLGDHLVPVAPCGTSLTAQQLDQLREATPGGLTSLLLAFDSDTAGRNATLRAWRMLRPDEAASATALTLPTGADPAQLVQDGLATSLSAAVDSPTPLTRVLVDVVLEAVDLTHLEGRVNATRMIANAVATLPLNVAVTTGAYLAGRIGDGLDPATIAGEIIDARAGTARASSAASTHNWLEFTPLAGPNGESTKGPQV